MKIFTQTFVLAGLTLWMAAPAAAQVDIGAGGNARAGANAGNALQNATQRAGNAVQRGAQGVGNAARRVEQGTRNLQQGARNLTGDAVQRTRQGAQNLRGTVNGQQGRLNGQGNAQLRANGETQFRANGQQGYNQQGYNQQGRFGANSSINAQANTPQIPARAQADAQFNAQADRNANWRKTQHNGEWWYYSPQGNWMYMRDGQWNKYDEQNFQRPDGQGGYSANFRGDTNADINSNNAWRKDGRTIYRLQSDNQDRQFIRMNGQQIWVGSDTEAGANLGGNDASVDANLDSAVDVE